MLVHRNVTQTIVHELGVGIVTGQYQAGALTSEKILSETFGAARTVTREAVKMLTSKGLVSSRPRTGITIEPEESWNLLDTDVLRWMLSREYSHNTVIAFFEFRLGIEPNAAALAARQASETDKANIAAAIERMYAAEHKDEGYLASDIAFHVAVLEATGNQFYLRMRDFIVTALTYSIRRIHPIDSPRTSALYHDKVARAICAGNSARAEKEMRSLIEHALELLKSTRPAVDPMAKKIA